MNWLFELSLSLSGFPINDAEIEFNSKKQQNLVDRENNQKRLANEIFKFHFEKNEYYRNLCILKSNQEHFTSWNEIPILNKKDLQVPFDQILSMPFDNNKMHMHNTSGSTGTPFKFAKTKHSHAYAWTLYDNRLKSLNINYGKDLQARFYGIPQKGIPYFKEKLKDLIAGRVRFPVFDLSDSKLSQTTENFKTTKFVYINGYTNSILLFANYLLKNNIVLKEICPTLRVVIPTSEVCTPVHKEIMERAFGVEVYNEYGAAELDIIAMEDLNHHFILNNETLLIELLDDLNQPVGIGESGRVVVTSLYNKAMPFIRYDIGDMAILGEPTETHHTLKSVEGRRNDSIQLPSGKISPGLTIYYVVKLLFEEKPNIKEFVVHQIKLDTFEFHYTSEKLLSDKEKTLISKGFDVYLESGLKLMFKRVDKIERTHSGKMKTFVSHLN
jgi:phenylacetate-CoA ligase